MPIGAYYGGRGEKVAREMRQRYGKRWQQVFYATAAKDKLRPGDTANKRAALKALADDRKRKKHS